MDVDASKRVAIVTGANTGIGRETALGLAKAGMKVFLACRNADKAREAATYIRQSCSHIPGGQADVDILVLDLQSLQSVRKCATDFKSRNLPLHLLVNVPSCIFCKLIISATSRS
jgi:NAD(P)-dependent dehydrogenase (short-subunit alcohol dehydrogenase family)